MRDFAEVAGAIAREMRTPLTAIEVATHRLQRALGPEPYAPELDALREQGLRLEALSRALLDMARPPEPNRRAVEVDRAVRTACELTRSTMERNRVELEVRAGPDLPAAQADPHQLREALLTLLDCVRLAMKGWEGKRRIVVETDRAPDGRVRIWIQGSGPGLAAGDEERIFLPFVSEWGGGGRGLWLSRLTILKQGGELHVVRRAGEEGGTTFLLLLEPFSNGQRTSDAQA